MKEARSKCRAPGLGRFVVSATASGASLQNPPGHFERPRLSAEHYRELVEGSGIAPEIVEASGARSVTAQEALSLGFADYQAGAGPVLPIESVNGHPTSYVL